MLKVGVTGGIGSGKSIVCRVFETLGVPIYYADQEARKLMQDDEKLKAQLISRFGTQSFADGHLNRNYLASRIFSSKSDREFLNGLVHPRVREDFIKWTEGKLDVPYVIEEAALLFESGSYQELDFMVLVRAPAALRISRIINRDQIRREDAEGRLKAQSDPDSFINLADFIINNDGKEFVVPQVLEADTMLRSGIKEKANGQIR